MSDIKDRNDCRYDLQIRGERIKAVCVKVSIYGRFRVLRMRRVGEFLPKYYQIYGFCGVNFLLFSIIFYEFHSRFLPGLVDMDFNQPRLVKGHGKACHIC